MRYKHYFHLLEEKILRFSDHPWSLFFLSFLSFIEAIFFPIPVDPFLMLYSTFKPKRWLIATFLSLSFSILGAFVTYQIAYFFWPYLENFFFSYLIDASYFSSLKTSFHENAFLSVFLSALTPLPFKLFSLISGIAQLDLFTFVSAALIGRAIRFGLISYLCALYGKKVYYYLRRRLGFFSLLLGLFFVFIYFVFKVFL